MPFNNIIHFLEPMLNKVFSKINNKNISNNNNDNNNKRRHVLALVSHLKKDSKLRLAYL